MANKNGDVDKFKRALDKQNQLEREGSRQARSAAEGEAAHHGLGALEKHSKGHPEQDATTKKSPQTTRSQSR